MIGQKAPIDRCLIADRTQNITPRIIFMGVRIITIALMGPKRTIPEFMI